MFARGCSIEDVSRAVDRTRGTTTQYLVEFIQATCPEGIDAWVTPETYRAVASALDQVGTQRIKPVFEHLDGAVAYDEIRLVKAHLTVRPQSTNPAPPAS